MDFKPVNIIFTDDEIQKIKIASRNYEPCLITRADFSTIVFPEKPDHISTKDHKRFIKEFIKQMQMNDCEICNTQLYYD